MIYAIRSLKNKPTSFFFLETFQLFPVLIIFDSTSVISIFKIQSASSFKTFHVCVTLTINKSPEFNICSY